MKLDNSLGFLLNKAAGEMKYALETALRPFDLTPAQWSVLARLSHEDGQTISDTGKSLYFDRPTMSGIVRRLVSKGLLTKTQDAHDQRISRLYISDSARRLMVELPPIAQKINQQALRSFNADEATVFKEYLRRALNNMSK